MIFLLAFISLALFPIAPWLGAAGLAAASFSSHWFWDSTSEWLELSFFWGALLSVAGMIAGVV